MKENYSVATVFEKIKKELTNKFGTWEFMCIENLRIGVWFRASHLSRLNLGMRRRVRLCCMLPLAFYSVMSASIKVWYRIPWSSQPPPTLRWKWKHVRRPTINNQHVTSPEKRDFPNMGMRTKWQCGFVCRNVPFLRP